MAVESGSIKVEGLQKTIKALQAFGADRAEIQNLNLQAAQTILATATPEVPIYKGNRGENGRLYQYKSGGGLKKSLRASKALGYAMVRAGNARVPYANPIHWGWFEDQNNFVQKNIRPNAFFMRALKKDYRKLIADYDHGLQQLIDKYGLGETK
jgi:hypothetical protein